MEADHELPPVDPTGWFDLWHIHVDWEGPANSEGDAQRMRTDRLFTVWERLERIAGRRSEPWQSWLLIDAADPSGDAIYLHTPNPNRDNFPFLFADVRWDVEPAGWLSDSVQGRNVQIGRSHCDGSELFWVRRRETSS